AAEHALAAAPANDRMPRWMRERVLAKRIRRGLARRDPDALQLFDDLRDTAPRTAMLRATATALNLATGPRAVPETAGPGVPLVLRSSLRG
ncbi:MAG TPA: hypothetical protein VM684_00270, partial [Gaiellales bacterium]|nr:hypothetical protein [Gaiellales bacterium]